jgi:hypothetical protein
MSRPGELRPLPDADVGIEHAALAQALLDQRLRAYAGMPDMSPPARMAGLTGDAGPDAGRGLAGVTGAWLGHRPGSIPASGLPASGGLSTAGS